MPDVFLAPSAGVSPFTMVFTNDAQAPGDVWFPRTHAPLKFEHAEHSDLSTVQKLWLCVSYFPFPAVITSLLQSGLDPNADSSRVPGVGLLPLEFAARRGNIAVVRALITAGARADRGMPYLWAAYTDNTEVMAVLQASGADPHRQAGIGESVLVGGNALHFAASNGARAAMRHLVVDLGADIEAADSFGRDGWWHAQSYPNSMPTGETVTHFLRKVKRQREQRASSSSPAPSMSGAPSSSPTPASAPTSDTSACFECRGPRPVIPGYVPRVVCAACFAKRMRAGQRSIAASYPTLQRDMQATRAEIFVRLAKGDFTAQVHRTYRDGLGTFVNGEALVPGGAAEDDHGFVRESGGGGSGADAGQWQQVSMGDILQDGRRVRLRLTRSLTPTELCAGVSAEALENRLGAGQWITFRAHSLKSLVCELGAMTYAHTLTTIDDGSKFLLGGAL
jgi:hypothetical protein